MENNLSVFIKRLKKLGIEIEIFANYPWLYLEKVSGKKVTEKRHSDHYFTLGWYRKNGREFSDLRETFNLIRKYVR